MSISDLQAKFGRGAAVTFEVGPNDVSPVVVLKTANGSCRVLLYAAHVLSWKDASGAERLFLSDTAAFQEGKAIRGGIPICWPQFGPNGPLQQHGFARTSQFAVEESSVDANSGAASVTLSLSSNKQTLKIWNFPFKISLKTDLLADGALAQTFSVQNTGTAPLQFTTALHTYFRVQDASNTSVHPLGGLHYFDKVLGAAQEQPAGQTHVKYEGEIDRVYYNAPSHCFIASEQGKKELFSIEKSSGLADLVVWNIGEAKQKNIADLSSWRDYVCAEVANVQHPVVIQPGQSWVGAQTLRYLGAGTTNNNKL